MNLADFLVPHENGGASAQDLEDFEKAFGLVLPQAMKAFYQIQNGGWFRRDEDFVITEDPEEDEDSLALSDFRPIGKTFSPHTLTIDTLLEWQQADGFLPDTIVPFCSDDGDDFYYIQADGQGERVWYIFHEDYDAFLEDPDSCLIAESFAAFLEKIHIRQREED